ncbi:DUF4214 domain-containing protein [Actinotalea sp.]|uniref:DUF4214 domain-containing protein n=1 Tax=Actinotalea sp. TaxID=1872145 RepID=UPI0035691BC3
MIVRLALSVVLALLGVGSGGLPTVVDAPSGATLGSSTASVVPAQDAGDAVADEVEVTQVEVVVAPLDEDGEVAPTEELQAADADPGALAADEPVGDGRVASEVLETDGFQTLGVTWPAETDPTGLDPQVRTRAVDGTWSQWQALEIGDSAPDAGSADAAAAGARGGTDSLWVGEADAVQVSFSAVTEVGPEGLDLTLVDAPATTSTAGAVEGAAWSGELTTTGAAFVQTSTAEAPTVISRSEWGARAQACTPNVATALVGAVVHHTAGSNSYSTVAQAQQQIRGDQAYHIDGRGWCDIGYNFIVDKWGNIYEGRANSLTKAVVGVHAGGFNTGTLGVSMLGTYDYAPSAATQRSVAQIIGWRLGAYGVNPEGTMRFTTLGGQNSSVPANTTVTLPRVIGHRDVAYTACPGNGGYAALPAIRSMASSFSFDQRFTQSNAVVKAMYEDLLGRAPDSGGLQSWSAMLAGGADGAALVRALTSSEEYIRLSITRAYQEVLGRAPESSGMAYWYERITSGTATVDDVKRRFYDSDEYFNRSGGTPEGYTDLLYRTMFERSASAKEATYWSGRITAIGRSAVVDAIWFSTEAAQYRAGGYYRTFLDREPDATGLRFWAKVLLDEGEGAVRIGIAGSDEYRALALKQYGTSAT